MDLYKNTMMKNRLPLTSPDGSSNRNPPERCSRSLYSRDSTQEDQEIPQEEDQDKNVTYVKVEVKEEESYVMGDEPRKEEESPLENSTDPGDTRNTRRDVKAEEKEEDTNIKAEEHPMEINTGESINPNPPERCPRPQYSRNSTQEHPKIPQDDQGTGRGMRRGSSLTPILWCTTSRKSSVARDVSHETLIKLVYERPGLWDTSCRHYSDRVEKQRLWQEVFQSVTPDWSTLPAKRQQKRGEKIVTRWRSLRDRFRRDLKKELEASRSGSSATTYKKSVYFDSLSFLKGVMDIRATVSSISEDDAAEEPEEGNGHGDDGEDGQPFTVVEQSQTGCSRISMSEGQQVLVNSQQTTRSRPTTIRPARRGRGRENRDVCTAMLSFIQEMRASRGERSGQEDPFLDISNPSAAFLRHMYHVLAEAPKHRMLDIQMAVFNYVVACVKAAKADQPLPVFVQGDAPQGVAGNFAPDPPPPPPNPSLSRPYGPQHYPPQSLHLQQQRQTSPIVSPSGVPNPSIPSQSSYPSSSQLPSQYSSSPTHYYQNF